MRSGAALLLIVVALTVALAGCDQPTAANRAAVEAIYTELGNNP